jgi:hypothetical protein
MKPTGIFGVMAILSVALLFFFSEKMDSSKEIKTAVTPNSQGWIYKKSGGIDKFTLYKALLLIGDKYGLQSKGSGASNDNYDKWQIAVFCKNNATAHFSISSDDGDLAFFLYAYGFKRVEDYRDFENSVITLLKEYGQVSQMVNSKILDISEIKAKEKYWSGKDLSSQCG